MNKTRCIFRGIFFLLAVSLLVYLNKKADDNTVTIAEFKFKMIEKVRTDSLDAKHKLNLLLKETTKYIDDSSRVREGIHYLVGLVGLWVIAELGFLILEKSSYRQP